MDPLSRKFQTNLKSLNKTILKQSNYQFDLGNFLDTNFRISTSNIYGLTNKKTLPHARTFIDDEIRDKIKQVISQGKPSNPDIARNLLIELLRRKVLYVGSECEREAFIGVEAEFDDLKAVLKSEYLELYKVTPPTLKNLMKEWDTHKPTIVFISCHGLPEHLYLQDEQGGCKEYSNVSLFKFFQARSSYTQCVILSACESLQLGELIKDECRNVICINRKVDINTARIFCNVLFEYLNDHSLDNSPVYEKAFGHATEYVGHEELPDSFAFKFLKGNKI